MYYGISLYIPRFSGDDYLNFFISGAVEIPGYIFSQLAVRYVGRRKPLIFTLIVAGVALLVTMAIPDGEIELNWVELTIIIVLVFDSGEHPSSISQSNITISPA